MSRRLVVLVTLGLVAALALVQRATSEFLFLLGLVALTALAVSAFLDVLAVVRGTDTIGDGIQNTTRRFGLYRAGIALFIGALLGHLFWPTPP